MPGEREGDVPEEARNWKAPEVSETDSNKRLMTGVGRNPDGSPDYSRAAYVPDPTGELAKKFAEADEKTKVARAEKLKIPDDIKPGTAGMIWYRLRNSLFVNNETLENAKRETEHRSGEARSKKRIETFRIEKQIRELKEEKDTLSRFVDLARGHESFELPAGEVMELLQKRVIDEYEKDLAEDPVEDRGGYARRIETARSLMRKLADEAPRGETQ